MADFDLVFIDECTDMDEQEFAAMMAVKPSRGKRGSVVATFWYPEEPTAKPTPRPWKRTKRDWRGRHGGQKAKGRQLVLDATGAKPATPRADGPRYSLPRMACELDAF